MKNLDLKSSYGVGMFIKTCLTLLIVCITFSSFTKDAASTNPTPFYAFPMFTYDYTDLNGNDFGSIEIDFHDENWIYPELDDPIELNVLVGFERSGLFYPQWNILKYCYTNPNAFASGVPMNDGPTYFVPKLQALNGDFTPDAWCAY